LVSCISTANSRLKRSARLIVTGMMRTVFALSAAWWLAVFPVQGQEAPPAFERAETEEEAVEEHDPFDPMIDVPKMVRVQFEHIEVSHKDLTRLMMEDSSVVSDAKPLRMKVQELVEKDKAKVFETQILVCRSGQKCTTESIYEFMSPKDEKGEVDRDRKIMIFVKCDVLAAVP